MIGVPVIGLMLRTVDQVQMKTVGCLADDDSLFRQSDARVRSVGEIGHEYALPDGGSLGVLDVLDVDHDLRKSFIENAWLDLERNLRAFQAIFEAAQSRLSFGRDVDAIAQREQPGAEDEDREDSQETPYPHAAGAHSSDFAVGGETAQANQDSDQNTHGQRVGEGERDGVGEDFEHAWERSAGTDDEF